MISQQTFKALQKNGVTRYRRKNDLYISWLACTEVVDVPQIVIGGNGHRVLALPMYIMDALRTNGQVLTKTRHLSLDIRLTDTTKVTK